MSVIAIIRASVLTGPVLGSLIRSMITHGSAIGLPLLVGFRPTAGPVAWLVALGAIATRYHWDRRTKRARCWNALQGRLEAWL
ncbi:MAG TPA: hypothetical protein VGP33_12585 [Chloroflexota bacterium]|jgi:hypothetical protein|nr:hypothetical protein [Chloroflexota bacterium]